MKISPFSFLFAATALLFAAAPQPAGAQPDPRRPLRELIAGRIAERAAQRAGQPPSAQFPPPAAGAMAQPKPGNLAELVFPAGSPYAGRQALAYVPSSIGPGERAPVLFALHGGGGNSRHMARDENYGLLSWSEKRGVVLVFPNGTGPMGGRMATWNAGNCCASARDNGADDSGFIRALALAAKQWPAADPERLFAAGMSNGGMMAHRIACESSDLFKGIASVAGPLEFPGCKPQRPVRILHIHALDDDHVLYAGGAGNGAFKDPSKITDFAGAEQTALFWAQTNRCSKAPAVDGYCASYPGCSRQSSVTLCSIPDGGHSWPGAPGNGRNNPSRLFDANDAIWRFIVSAP